MVNFILFKTEAKNFPVKVGLNGESTKALLQEKFLRTKKYPICCCELRNNNTLPMVFRSRKVVLIIKYITLKIYL
jgi:hypothetical protein